MAIEQRGNQHYYYSKRRVAGRVQSHYEGSGLGAELAALRQKRDGAQRRFQADCARADRVLVEQHDRLLKAIAQHCTLLARCLMLSVGHHQVKGSWRKRRTMAKRTSTEETMPALPAPDDHSATALGIVLKRCNRPDATSEDTKAMRRMLEHYPHLAELGDMMLRALTESVRGDGTALAAVVRQGHVERRKHELGYDAASTVEQPLLLHLILCEQRMGETEMRYERAMARESFTYQEGAYWEGRVTSAQSRYLRAVETLARVRRVRVEAFATDGTRGAGVAIERPG